MKRSLRSLAKPHSTNQPEIVAQYCHQGTFLEFPNAQYGAALGAGFSITPLRRNASRKSSHRTSGPMLLSSASGMTRTSPCARARSFCFQADFPPTYTPSKIAVVVLGSTCDYFIAMSKRLSACSLLQR